MTRLRMFTLQYLLGDVDPKHGDLALLAYCYVSGLLDAVAFYNWGVFVAMQTGKRLFLHEAKARQIDHGAGNTVILCLSTARLPSSQPYGYGSTLTALLSFLVGAIMTTHISLRLGAKKRPVLFTNMLIQGLLICLCAALITAGITPTVTNGGEDPLLRPEIMGGIAPLAFQTGMQIATSRLLGFGQEIPVNVLTSTYAALAADTKIFVWDNKPRNRRLAAVVLFFGGALCATWILKVGPGTVLAIWLGAGIKLVTALAVGLFMPEKAKELPK